MGFPDSLQTRLQSYSKQSQGQILDLLINQDIPESEQAIFNDRYQACITHTLKKLMENREISDICSLLNLVWKSLKNKSINKAVLVFLLDSVLQCFSISDLDQVLKIINQRVGEMREALAEIHYPLLRIINTLLKRISKTTDFQVRGQLHLTITRIFYFCHESGFDYRPNILSKDNKIEFQDTFLDTFKQSNITLQFYQEFWELQKYFLDISQLGKSQNSKEDLMSIRLKRIELILGSVVNYFELNPPLQHKDFSVFPIKFLKLPNLLVLQLQDSYFRLTILIQTLIFCSNFKVFPVKHQIEVSNQSKQILKRIEKGVNQYLQAIISLRPDTQKLLTFMHSFLKNDTYWIQLKDNWREKKKNFRIPSSEVQLVDATKQKKPVSIYDVFNKCKKQIQQKVEVRPEFIDNFLKHTQAPILKKQPISPSFKYFYSQARQCIQSFDEKEQCQTYFQSRSDYNLFQWKAFRSLQKERIVTGLESDKNNNKFADYRLLDFVKRKEQIFEGEPRKRVKLSDDERN